MILSLQSRSLAELAADPLLSGHDRRVHHVHSLGPESVKLSKLNIGGEMLKYFPVREVPRAGLWSATSYSSVAPAMFVLNDVVVHSSCGILAVDRYVVSESLFHTDPAAHSYVRTESGIDLTANLTDLDEVCLSVLAGNWRNYYHWNLESIARLGLVPSNYLAAARFLLLPSGLSETQQALVDMLPRPKTMELREIRDGESLRVRTLILPHSVGDGFQFHPCITTVFNAIKEVCRFGNHECPERLYVDRRTSPWRTLVNEPEVIQQLEKLGFVAVALESLSVQAQIALFHNAKVIVAPHGAGLTNVVFAQPGCIVIELQMDSYVNWCYRHLSGVFGLEYDCVIGRAVGPWLDLSHRHPWLQMADFDNAHCRSCRASIGVREIVHLQHHQPARSS